MRKIFRKNQNWPGIQMLYLSIFPWATQAELVNIQKGQIYYPLDSCKKGLTIRIEQTQMKKAISMLKDVILKVWQNHIL